MAGEIAPLLTTLYSLYNVVFQPLLGLGPYAALGTFSVALAAIFSLIYWRFLDIEKQQEIRDKLEKKQEKMKEARKNGNTEEASEFMQKTMELNQEMMKLNIKPMIGTMVFVALFFPWLGATFAPTVQVQQTGNGVYTGNLTYAGSSVPVSVDNSTGNVTVEVEGSSAGVGGTVRAHGIRWNVVKFKEHTGGIFAKPKGEVVKFNAEFVQLPFSLPMVGDELNWLGFYILLAMPLTFGFRKMLGIT